MRLVSTAGTGFFYTMNRLRTKPKMSMMKYDPKGMSEAVEHAGQADRLQ